jgi:hypothetical protein
MVSEQDRQRNADQQVRGPSRREPGRISAATRRLLGYGLFIGLMTAGYYYNVTFVQLGLHDLGTRVLGMAEVDVGAIMGLLALVTGCVAVLTGLAMYRRPIGFRTKLRVASIVVLVQTVLTAVAGGLPSPEAFVAWVLAGGAALGIGVPITFGLTVDLVAVRHRGYVAAVIAGGAYFAAAALAPAWTIDAFSAQLVWPMAGGTLVLVALAWAPLGLVDGLGEQHREEGFAAGRFLRNRHLPARLLIAYLIGIGTIFFIDSLGFLRMIFTPEIVADTWHSPDREVQLLIAGAHVLGAAIGGLLYARLSGRTLLLWIFAIFALVQLVYAASVRLPMATTTLSPALLYAIAVSLYTVITFAVWADLSTPRTIGLVTALGVGVAGWLSTFLSTAISLQLQALGIDVARHLDWVAAIALVAFSGVLALLFLSPAHAGARART